jgi:LPXTG-site transpeptidase (sortase) family protein
MRIHIRRVSSVVQYVLLPFGLGTLGYVSISFWIAKTYQATQARKFTFALQSNPAGGVKTYAAPFKASLKPKRSDGAAIGSLVIPRLGLSTMVVEGADDRDLELGAGHIPGTSFPGQPGNVGIAGHRDTFFRPLRRIQRGDAITLTTLGGAFEYRVVSIEIVKPDDIWVLYPGSSETLTLVTCYPFLFVGPAPRRFIIRAERAALPTGQPHHRPAPTDAP